MRQLIFPDSFHLQANNILIGAIREYVAGGGSLMLVYDAGTNPKRDVTSAPDQDSPILQEWTTHSTTRCVME